jgi:hypothetical protein
MRGIGLVDAASLRMADRELLDLLVDLTRSQVRAHGGCHNGQPA